MQATWVQSLVKELRSNMLHSAAKKNKKFSLLILKALFLSILTYNHTDKKYQVELIFISSQITWFCFGLSPFSLFFQNF